MKLYPSLATLCTAAIFTTAAHAQLYKLHQAEISGGAIGQFTPTIHINPNSTVTNTATESFGGLFSLTEHPVPFAGIKFNYGYTEFSERYAHPNNGQPYSAYTAEPHVDAHEATAAYLLHPRFRGFHHLPLAPFVSIGGGAIDFVPYLGKNQWRGAGLLEAGLDIPTSNPHFGFRLQGRALFYRSPNFFQPNLGAKNWVATTEPAFGFYYRF